MSAGIIQMWQDSDFSGFDTFWFMNTGTTMAFALLISVFSTKLSELFSKLLVDILLRGYDRGWTWNMIKKSRSDSYE
jgi:hypothetical protein